MRIFSKKARAGSVRTDREVVKPEERKYISERIELNLDVQKQKQIEEHQKEILRQQKEEQKQQEQQQKALLLQQKQQEKEQLLKQKLEEKQRKEEERQQIIAEKKHKQEEDRRLEQAIQQRINNGQLLHRLNAEMLGYQHSLKKTLSGNTHLIPDMTSKQRTELFVLFERFCNVFFCH